MSDPNFADNLSPRKNIASLSENAITDKADSRLTATKCREDRPFTQNSEASAVGVSATPTGVELHKHVSAAP